MCASESCPSWLIESLLLQVREICTLLLVWTFFCLPHWQLQDISKIDSDIAEGSRPPNPPKGLKHNDVMRKYEQQYEREFVKSKLRRMVERVQEIRAEWESDPRFIEDVEDLRSFRLGEEELVGCIRAGSSGCDDSGLGCVGEQVFLRCVLVSRGGPLRLVPFRPTRERFRPTEAAMLAKLGPDSTQAAPTSAEVGRCGPGFETTAGAMPTDVVPCSANPTSWSTNP